jgi:hypothetical protein
LIYVFRILFDKLIILLVDSFKFEGKC